MPPWTEPPTEQTPLHWMQPHEMGEVPQVLGPHWARTAPPATTMQSWPGAQVSDDGVWQATFAHVPFVIDHLGSAELPATQEAIVRPAPWQSS